MWSLTEESTELADMLSTFLGDNAHAEAARSNLESGSVPESDTWAGLVDDLGLVGFVLPESLGGGGGTLRDAVVAQYSWGATCASAPLLSHLLVTEALVRLDASSNRDALLDELVSGKVLTVVPRPVTGIRTVSEAGDEVVLDGAVDSVLDASAAQTALLLLPVGADGDVSVVAVDLSASGVTVVPRRSWTGTRSYGDLRLDRATGRIIGVGSPEYADDVLTVTRLLLGAERLGGTFACLDRSVEYAQSRVQFDRPIGSFQGVKHPLAQVFVQAQMAQSQLRKAVSEFDGGSEGSYESALLAAIVSDRAFRQAAEHDIEVHGGMGYTWENDSHLFYRRSRSDSELAGSSTDNIQSLLTTFQERTLI